MAMPSCEYSRMVLGSLVIPIALKLLPQKLCLVVFLRHWSKCAICVHILETCDTRQFLTQLMSAECFNRCGERDTLTAKKLTDLHRSHSLFIFQLNLLSFCGYSPVDHGGIMGKTCDNCGFHIVALPKQVLITGGPKKCTHPRNL